MTDLKQSIFLRTKEDIESIEKELEKELDPYLDIVHDIAGHILFAGGKRIRPLLMVLCARLCGYNGTFAKTLSVIFEYLHTSTLLHDDLIDGAVLRRGKPAAHSLWDNSIVVLTGDFLFAKAGSIAAESGNIKIMKTLSDVYQKMAQGEIHQLLNKGSIDISEEEYFDVIRSKTGVLIEGACRVGALLANASEQEEKAVALYGSWFGLVFQMIDDMLDYTADTDSLGKNVGTDLREGKLTLPVIYALKKANKDDRSFMEEIISNKIFSLEQFEQFKQLLIKYKGLEYVEGLAKKYIAEAVSALSIFDDSKTKDTLLMITNYFLERKE
jgi:octaprenyl-diphosphate synthase